MLMGSYMREICSKMDDPEFIKSDGFKTFAEGLRNAMEETPNGGVIIIDSMPFDTNKKKKYK